MKIKVVTNFNSLDTENQKKIYEDLGSFLALAYLEQLKTRNLDNESSAGTLQINTNEATNTDTETSIPQLQSSPNGSYQDNQQPTNTHLPLNENNKFSKPTEGQSKD